MKTNTIDNDLFMDDDAFAKMSSEFSEINFDNVNIEDALEEPIFSNPEPVETEVPPEQSSTQNQDNQMQEQVLAAEKAKEEALERERLAEQARQLKEQELEQKQKELEEMQKLLLQQQEEQKRLQEEQRKQEELRREEAKRQEEAKQQEEQTRGQTMNNNQTYNQAFNNTDFQNAHQNEWDPNEEPEIEIEIEEPNDKWNRMNVIWQDGRLKKFLTKVAILVVLVLCFVGIPVIIISIMSKNKPDNGNEIVLNSSSTETDNLLPDWFTTQKTDNNPQEIILGETNNTEELSTQEIQSTATSPEVSVDINTPEIDATQTTSNSRFTSTEDLYLYINSSTATILMTEKKAINDYINGTISKEDCLGQLQQCTAASNEVLHLLVVNKKLFENEGKAQQYANIESDLIDVMYYCDVASGLIANDTPIPQIMDILNIQ